MYFIPKMVMVKICAGAMVLIVKATVHRPSEKSAGAGGHFIYPGID
jgi:hypothetical protein